MCLKNRKLASGRYFWTLDIERGSAGKTKSGPVWSAGAGQNHQKRGRALGKDKPPFQFPNKYFYPDQYNNEINWKAHYQTTAPEIWWQTQGRITHFVAGLGTTGTFIGTAKRLKEFNPFLEAISMQPDSPLHGLEGMKHLETAIVPGIYDDEIADKNVEVATEDAQAMTRRLAKEEGLFVGVSSGANVFAAVRLAKDLNEDAVIVTILCDGGGKYLHESFWDE